jgi:hypothetical protein
MADASLQKSLWIALQNGAAAQIQYLVNAGAEVNLPLGSPEGETPLIRAVTEGNIGLVKLLLQLGADPSLPCKGPRSWTPLMFAHDNPEMMRELISAGANVKARTKAFSIEAPGGGAKHIAGGETALHLAVAAGNAEAVKVLLEAGAEVEARAENGCAPLDYAVRLGSVNQVVTNLVGAGAQLTPERLEAMHSTAHRPDSDVVAFPFQKAGAESSLGQGGFTIQSSVHQTANPPEFRCPKCHALIYSRKPKVCGQCGALLPSELVLTAEQARALDESRRWARDLADRFSSPGSPHQPTLRGDAPVRMIQKSATESPEELLQGISCAEEFRRRPRPDFWLYAVGYGFTLFITAFLFIKMGGIEPSALLIMTAFMAALTYRAWHRASPICPDCHENIRFCAAAFCHVCGKPLSHKRCEGCAVDNSWISFLRPYGSQGNFRWIAYCPGCGVELDSKVPRWRAGGRL